MKRTISIILLVLTVLLSFISCQKEEENPFQTTEVETKEEFYSMTAKESTAKYGQWYMTTSLMQHDEKFTYGLVTKTGTSKRSGNNEEDYYSVLYQAPLGEKFVNGYPACTDPMCSHRPGSGCVFDGIKTFGFANGKLYFSAYEEVVKDGDYLHYYTLYRYDKNTNSRILIDQSQTAITMMTYDQTLYYYKTVEDENFNSKTLFFKIDKNDKYTKLYETDTQSNTAYYFAGGTKLITKYYIPGDDPAITLTLFDYATGESQQIVQREGVFMHGLYGNKLLYKVDGNTIRYYLYDISNNETKTVFSFKAKEGCEPFTQTDRCFIYSDIRENSSDPFILHIYFPETDTEETYNFSELFDKLIDVNIYAQAPERGAVKLRVFRQGSWKELYEIDLKSGKVKDLQASEG